MRPWNFTDRESSFYKTNYGDLSSSSRKKGSRDRQRCSQEPCTSIVSRAEPEVSCHSIRLRKNRAELSLGRSICIREQRPTRRIVQRPKKMKKDKRLSPGCGKKSPYSSLVRDAGGRIPWGQKNKYPKDSERVLKSYLQIWKIIDPLLYEMTYSLKYYQRSGISDKADSYVGNRSRPYKVCSTSDKVSGRH